MHCISRTSWENGKRRRQRPAPHYAIPCLSVKASKEVWTWDITNLPTARLGLYLSYDVVLELFSRSVVGWKMANCRVYSLRFERYMRATESRFLRAYLYNSPHRIPESRPQHLNRQQRAQRRRLPHTVSGAR
jgi:hypothetical protein